MAGIDGQSRASDEAVERRVQARYEQKMAKCGRVAEQNNLTFIPAVFLHTGQIHCASKRLIKEQIRQKIKCFEGEAKRSTVRSVIKRWSKCISMII